MAQLCGFKRKDGRVCNLPAANKDLGLCEPHAGLIGRGTLTAMATRGRRVGPAHLEHPTVRALLTAGLKSVADEIGAPAAPAKHDAPTLADMRRRLAQIERDIKAPPRWRTDAHVDAERQALACRRPDAHVDAERERLEQERALAVQRFRWLNGSRW